MSWKVRNVVEDAGSFYVRLYEGKKRRKIRLGRCDEFPTKASLERASEEVRTRHHVAVSGRTITLSQFVRFFYLPVAKEHVRAITHSGYETIYRVHIQPQKIANLKLWDFSTVEVQQLLHAIAASRDLTKMTLKHIKATLSGIFRHAIQIGFYKGANPVHEAQLPWRARPSSETEAYTLDDIRRTLPRLELPVRAAFAVASFAGLRKSEIQGLEWPDIEEDRLSVRRSVVAGIANAPKSKASRSWVPIVPPLAAILERAPAEAKRWFWAFIPDDAGPRSRTLATGNEGRRSSVCRVARGEARSSLEPLRARRGRSHGSTDSPPRFRSGHALRVH